MSSTRGRAVSQFYGWNRSMKYSEVKFWGRREVNLWEKRIFWVSTEKCSVCCPYCAVNDVVDDWCSSLQRHSPQSLCSTFYISQSYLRVTPATSCISCSSREYDFEIWWPQQFYIYSPLTMCCIKHSQSNMEQWNRSVDSVIIINYSGGGKLSLFLSSTNISCKCKEV